MAMALRGLPAGGLQLTLAPVVDRHADGLEENLDRGLLVRVPPPPPAFTDVSSGGPVGGLDSGGYVAEVDHAVGKWLRAGELQNARRLV